MASDAKLLREFMGNRDALLAGLFGRQVKRSPLRDDILRVAIIYFEEGRDLLVTEYQAICAPYGSRNLIRDELYFMDSRGVLLVEPSGPGRAPLVARVTKRLVRFYNQQMPSLREQVEILFRNGQAP